MISVATITIKATDPRAVARFWRDLLSYAVAPNHTDSMLLRGDGPDLLIQPAAEQPGDGAIHLDLRPKDADAAVSRALVLGATLADVGQTGAEGWTVLRDPGGTLFCILQGLGDAEAGVLRDPGWVTPID